MADAGSANGTFFNGRQLEPRVAVQITDGDRVRFADYEFAFMGPRSLVSYLKEWDISLD